VGLLPIPPGVWVKLTRGSPGSSKERPTGAHSAPHAFLLPYLEQSPLYNGVQLSTGVPLTMWGYSVNSTATLTVTQALLCPSDGLAGRTGHQQLPSDPMGPDDGHAGLALAQLPRPAVCRESSPMARPPNIARRARWDLEHYLPSPKSLVYPDGGSASLKHAVPWLLYTSRQPTPQGPWPSTS